MDFRTRFPLRLWRPNVDEEVDAELEFHLQMRRRELVARGMSEADASRAALARFGDYRRARRVCRALGHQREEHMRVAQGLSELRQDAAFAIRQMVAAPGFALVAVATLALGIGASTAIFSAVNAIVLRPLPVPEPDRLVVIGETWQTGISGNVSVGNFVDMAAAQTVFESVAATVVESMTVARDEGAERVLGGRVSGGYFDVFGVRPALGRVFGAAEDEPGRDQVVVLGHRFWTRQFAGDPRVLGRDITLDARPYRIIGVMPAAFDFTADGAALWIPIAFTPKQRATHDEHYMDVYARLRRGTSIAQAHQQLDAIGRTLAERFPRDNAENGLAAHPLMQVFVGDYRQRLLVLLGAVGFVLLIACGNVSNLLLARGASRARELAVRTALGAGQGRLARQLFTESLVLGLAAAAAGVGLARVLISLLRAYGPPGVPRLEQVRLDGTAVGFAVALALLSSVVFGVVPAWRASRADVNTTLKEAVRGAGGRGARDTVRSLLIATEVALALVLLVGAGLLIRSAIEAQRLAPGFNPRGVFSARFSLPSVTFPDAASRLHAAEAVEASVAALPGVTRAAISTTVPGFGGFYNGLVPEGEAPEPRNIRDSRTRFVTVGFFRTLGISIVKGRGFVATDRAGAPLVIIVNQTLAERLWPGQDPIGRRVNCCSGGPKAVVGVAVDVRAGGPAQPIEAEFYLPLAQLDDLAWSWTRGNLFVAARSDGDPASLAPGVRHALNAIDPGIPLFSVMTMEARMAGTLETARFNTMLLVMLGGAGLLLAGIGIYGVLAYFATQRTAEIGIRIALGASKADVLRLVVRQAARPVAGGLIAGAIGAALATRAIAAQLINVQPTDPLTFAAVVLTLAAAALLAALIPARRAARMDPSRALQAT